MLRLSPPVSNLVSNWTGKLRHRFAQSGADCRAVRGKCDAMSELTGKPDAPDKREAGPEIHQLSEICPISVRDVPYRTATLFAISGSII